MSVSDDEPNLVPAAGLLPAAALAQKLGLAELVEARVRLAEHGANGGTKALSVVGSMLAGGDSIDDVAVLRAGALPDGSVGHERIRFVGGVCRRPGNWGRGTGNSCSA